MVTPPAIAIVCRRADFSDGGIQILTEDPEEAVTEKTASTSFSSFVIFPSSVSFGGSILGSFDRRKIISEEDFVMIRYMPQCHQHQWYPHDHPAVKLTSRL